MKLKDDIKSKMVLTTKYVLCSGSPIVTVLYDEDDDWQLFGEDEITEDEEAYLVSVEEILEIEPVLKRLPSLEHGQCAVREINSTKWIIDEID